MPTGPRLPRKNIALSQAKKSLDSAAYQIGVILAIQRHRAGLTEEEIAEALGTDNNAISELENGGNGKLTDGQVDRLFSRLDLDRAGVHANFVKWWRKNAGG